MESYIIAHRGALGHPFENRLPGIEAAIDFGADFVEIDIRASLDEELVAFHNRFVHRTAGRKRRVSSLTLAELKQLTAVKNSSGELIRTPTFGECIETARGKIGLVVEIKDKMSSHLLREMILIASSKLPNDKFIIVSRNRKVLTVIKTIDPSVLTGIHDFFAPIAIPFMFNKPKFCDILIINELIANRMLVKRAKRFGLMVFISTVWGIRSSKILYSLGSDGVYVNIRNKSQLQTHNKSL